MQICLTSLKKKKKKETCGMCSECFRQKEKQRDLRLLPPTRLSSASREHHVVSRTLAVSCRCCWKKIFFKNLGSKCHNPDLPVVQQQRRRRRTAFTEPDRCQGLSPHFCLVPHPLSDSLGDFTPRKGGGAFWPTTRSCVGGKPRND